MARPRSAGYGDQRDTILAHAAALFAHRGYAGTSMQQVAAACGLSKPALYHYFTDKNALLAEIALGHVQRLQALVAQVQAQGLGPREHLAALIHAFVLAYADAQHAHRVLTEDVRFLPDTPRRQVQAAQRQVVRAFADAVVQLRPDTQAAQLATPLAMLLFGMINWMFTWLKPGGAVDHAAMAPVVEQLFLGGLPAVRL
jgi:TetR/AcrR family transcriptional regulator